MPELASLGQVAGIAGIAIGAVVLILRPLIEKGLTAMPPRDRARVVLTIALGAFGLGTAGLLAWAYAERPGGVSVATRGDRSPAVVSGGSAVIDYGGAERPPAPAGTAPPAAPPSGARIETQGDGSPGVAAGGDVRIRIDQPPRP